MKNRLIGSALFVIFGLAFLSGCATQGPMLLDFEYRPPQDVSAGAGKATFSVSPFKDDRGKVPSVIGKRSVDDEANDLVVQGTAADKVTAALKSALKARGIAEKDHAAWDFTEAGLPSDGAGLLVSGEIKKLWVDARSRFANTTVKADVQIRISVADLSQKKVIRVMNVSSSMERQALVFSTDVVEGAVSDALTAALDQIFNDEDVQKRLK